MACVIVLAVRVIVEMAWEGASTGRRQDTETLWLEIWSREWVIPRIDCGTTASAV